MSSEEKRKCKNHGLISIDNFLCYVRHRKNRKKAAYEYICKLCRKDAQNKSNLYLKDWRQKNKLAANSIKNRYNRNLRYDVLCYYSQSSNPFCNCCGNSTYEFLSLDHRNGGGNIHRKETSYKDGKGSKCNMYRWAKTNGYPDIFRVLCHNCNQSMGAYGYCPHQKKENINVPVPKLWKKWLRRKEKGLPL